MRAACAGWWKEDVGLGTATSMKAAFNDGNGVWGNNEGADSTLPAGVEAQADGVSGVLTWEPSTDDTGATKYQVTRAAAPGARS